MALFVKIRKDAALLQLVREALSWDGLADDDRSQLKKSTIEAEPETDAKEQSLRLCQPGGTEYGEVYLPSLLKGARLSFTVGPEREAAQETNEGIEERRRYLLLLKAEKEYQTLTKNITVRERRAQDKRDFKSVIQQGSVGANMFMARLTGLIFCYYISRNLFQEESHRLLFSLAGGVGIMLVELILYIIREYKRDEIRKREMREHDLKIKRQLGNNQ